MSNYLTRREQKLFEFMLHNANADISIEALCKTVAIYTDDARRAQQHIGAVISKVNKKQSVYEIVPGLHVKRTYRLQIKELLL